MNNLLEIIGILIGAGAGSFFGLKGAINGLRKDVTEIKECAREMHDNIIVVKERLRG